MTPAKKWLTFGFIVILGLGGGAGGAYYYHTRELQAVRDRTTKDLLVSRARSLLLEAALATRYGNYAMAFERAIRAQAMAARIGLPMDKEFAELQQLLLQQRPDIELATRLVMLADRIEPPAPPGNPDPAIKGGAAPTTGDQIGISTAKPVQPQPTARPPAAPPASQTGTAPTTPTTPPAAPVAPASPAAVPAATPQPSAATAPPAPTTASATAPLALPKRGQSPEASIEEGRQALGQAKLLLISGREAPAVIEWLARAQVVLDDSGKSDMDEQILTAIKAVRAGDDIKAQKTIDAALGKLKSP